MPIVNGKYQNPGWVNGQRPAIDAAELNAISNTLERLDEAPVLPSLTNPGTAADLLSGKQLIDANGNVLTGTMPNRGAIDYSVAGGYAMTIPQGYHDGTGKVTGLIKSCIFFAPAWNVNLHDLPNKIYRGSLNLTLSLSGLPEDPEGYPNRVNYVFNGVGIKNMLNVNFTMYNKVAQIGIGLYEIGITALSVGTADLHVWVSGAEGYSRSDDFIFHVTVIK